MKRGALRAALEGTRRGKVCEEGVECEGWGAGGILSGMA